MRITNVQVRNFRCFDDVGINIDLPDINKPVSIVGHNNSGKSNFITAMLYGLAVRAVNDTAFGQDDLHLKDVAREIDVQVTIDPPLSSSDAYNKVKEMPVLRLRAFKEDEGWNVQHYCADKNGKAIFNPRAVKRGKATQYTAEQLDILNAAQRSGAESVRKWRHKLRVYYIDSAHIHQQLKASRWSLLGKVIAEIKKEFSDPRATMRQGDGVHPSHVGQPKLDVFTKAMGYLEDHVLTTARFEELVSTVERVIKEQLDISSEHFDVHLGQPSADYFFDNLSFFLSDHADKPKLPVGTLGSGFVSLFVIALLRALVDADSGGNVFIIEEPETYLHEHYQEYFYKVLTLLAQTNQVLYSTHSKKFVDVFEPASIIRFSKPDIALCTKAVVMSPKQVVSTPRDIDGFVLNNPSDFGKYLRTLEPNVGNVAFAARVIVVEGPMDLLAYRTALEPVAKLSLRNIAIVSAWGKDPICAIIDFCRAFRIPVFAIHDWDLPQNSIDVSIAPEKSNEYGALTKPAKAQYSKNHAIGTRLAEECIHRNKLDLEAVLGIPAKEKSAASVFSRIQAKPLQQIREEYPLFLPDSLLKFLDVTV